MNCLICGAAYALIRETEIEMARITGKAHVDCNGHSKYMTLMPSEIEQQAAWYSQAKEQWNDAADGWNQWDSLDAEEKRYLAVAKAKANDQAQF